MKRRIQVVELNVYVAVSRK